MEVDRGGGDEVGAAKEEEGGAVQGEEVAAGATRAKGEGAGAASVEVGKEVAATAATAEEDAVRR